MHSEDNKYHDWLELYNAGDDTINLKNYALSTKDNGELQWSFPDAYMQPGEYKIIYLSGKDNKKDNGIHANIKLSSKGETVYLLNKDGIISTEVYVPVLGKDISYAREKENYWIKTDMPTPGFENSEMGYKEFKEKVGFGQKDIYISEIMSINTTSIVDRDSEHSDWIEIVNRGTTGINLEGYGLSDDKDRLMLWRFPKISLEPGEVKMIFASGKDIKNQEELHTNFKIASSGEELYLSDNKGVLLDKIYVPGLKANQSCGRDYETGKKRFYEKPTPGDINTGGYKSVLKKPKFSLEAGFFNSEQTVELSAEEGCKTYYTTDGSIPDINSAVYAEPIKITKTTVLRAVAISENSISSYVETNTYFINEKKKSGIVSITTDSENLWDYNTGIYVMGPNADEKYPHVGANFWQEWEKPCHVEFYNEDKEFGFELDAGIKIFGQFSRAQSQKSFTIKAREEYGTEAINYPIFPHKKNLNYYKSFLLRQSGQDNYFSHMRDSTISSIIRDTGVDYMENRPVILYMNGEYWGIYYMHEQANEDYLAYNHNIDNPKNIDLLKGNGFIKSGDYKAYKELLAYFKSHDMSKKDNYEYAKTKIDIVEYIDYQIIQIYCANADNGNLKYWCERNESAKWRWIIFDMDWTFYNSKQNTFSIAFNPEGTGFDNRFHNTFIVGLLKNDEFKKLFVERLIYHLNNTFATERVLRIIEEHEAMIKDEMPFQIKRWGTHSSIEKWERIVNDMKDFAVERQKYLFKYMRAYFDIPDEQMSRFSEYR
jgi:hypothetical protein